MKNYPYSLYTAIGLLLLYVLIASIATPLVTRWNIENALSRDIETARQESKIIESLSEGISDAQQKEKLRERIQRSITSTDNQIIFNSILDWSGKYVCYPNKKELGKAPLENNALKLSAQDELSGKILYEFIFKKEEPIVSSAIILLTPIKDSDWIIGSHINKDRVFEETANFKNRLYTVFAVIALVTLLFVLGSLRVISTYYQRLLALKSSQLEDGVLNLSKLNASLENYQKSLSQQSTPDDSSSINKQEDETNEVEDASSSKSTKQRIITYVRNEILSIATEDISYIYVENTITYVVRKDGRRSTTGESLDLIYSYLDERFFFRVNRQIIVAISAIETITKFGNSKLKIQVNPASDVDIIIGKNKAASFKQWLDL